MGRDEVRLGLDGLAKRVERFIALALQPSAACP